ncbi:MAG TPA: hypothetical protein VEG68_12725 [Terriglobales bacterium]|nr:hypothetical protein [Terriglobales bacterium]
MKPNAGVILLTCLLLPLVCIDVASNAQGVHRYDGHWWLSVSPTEREGFLDGYIDCYIYEYKGPARFTTISLDEARDLVTRFYEDNPSHLDEPVSDVLDRFRDHPGEKLPRDDGEPIKGRHGFYDGTYWKQISLDGKAQQLGFVGGHLWCHEHLSRNKGGMFSKSPAEYRALITQWYRLNEETGDIDAKREPMKIADVLFKFRDRAAQESRAKSR